MKKLNDRCGNGHLLTEDNIYRNPSSPNTRRCRKCRAGWAREREYSPRITGWGKKPVTGRMAPRIARYYAGRILADAVEAGWAPPDVVAAYGPGGLQMVSQALGELAWRLESTGDPKGRAK